MASVLEQTLLKALEERRQNGVPYSDATRPLPFHAGDFFSNDYLSLSQRPGLREKFINELQDTPLLFGSTGTRPISGTTSHHVEVEKYFREQLNVPSAMLFNGGYMANLAFFACVPQADDVLLHDSLVHASIHDGMRTSRARNSIIPFRHNSLTDFEESVKRILQKFPKIAAGKATLFVVLESVYSMDGTFCPMTGIVKLVERYVPRASAHIAVDEAHSIGVYGPHGLGLVREWGLEKRIHTVIFPLTKAVNIIGAVVTMSPNVYKYIMNYSRPFLYSTSIPHIDLKALRFCFEVIRSPMADQLRSNLVSRSHLFHRLFKEATKDISSNVLSLLHSSEDSRHPGGLISPIFPIHTRKAVELQKYLNDRGYAAQGIPFPIVPRGQERIRVVIHAGNTEEDIVKFLGILRGWALEQAHHTDSTRSRL